MTSGGLLGVVPAQHFEGVLGGQRLEGRSARHAGQCKPGNALLTPPKQGAEPVGRALSYQTPCSTYGSNPNATASAANPTKARFN